ncbi:MAG: PCRF domain-containing protein, partial [Candidatus Marinimicrobia bacterium]|nr:PCRF domain-containing protein [Candidatus Neomarinimicrobiota bacterium]
MFDLDNQSQKLEKLRKKSSDQNFWNNSQNATSVLKKISIIEKEIQLWEDLARRNNDMQILFEFAEAGEVELIEIENELEAYKNIIYEVELKLTLGRPEDLQNAIVSIHPGAGGTESQDWAQMLYRMYSRWVEKKDFKLDVIDYQPGDEAGIKDVTFEVKGDYSFGL